MLRVVTKYFMYVRLSRAAYDAEITKPTVWMFQVNVRLTRQTNKRLSVKQISEILFHLLFIANKLTEQL